MFKFFQEPWLRIMSFNIRRSKMDDGKNAWSARKDMVASMIRFHHVDFVGIQEAYKNQMDDLQARLPNYASLGVARDDGHESGEFSAIFYQKSRFDVLDQSTFWLSEAPEHAGSVGWDAALPRIVTWAKFKDKATQTPLFHFNTHFDHMGRQARVNGAYLLLQKIDALAGTNPVIVTGDFNCLERSEPYRVLTQHSQNNQPTLQDARYVAQQGHHGPAASYNNFDIKGNSAAKIDYIFVKNQIEVLQHGILAEVWNRQLPSDHYPVVADVILKNVSNF